MNAEIQYIYTWNNVRSGKNRVYIKIWNERDYTFCGNSNRIL